MSNTLTPYVALLRAINVGKRQVKMEDLRQLFTSLRFQNVKTYINSGNVLFESSEIDESTSIPTIEQELQNKFGFEVKTFLRTITEMQETLKNNPFKEIKSLEVLYVAFIHQPLTAEQKNILQTLNNQFETYKTINREIFVLVDKQEQKLPFSNNLLEKKLKLSATTRNLNTVKKVVVL